MAAAEFPQHRLRFRNDDLLARLGLDQAAVKDDHFIAAFGQFQGREPFLALCYHGYQFGQYNPLEHVKVLLWLRTGGTASSGVD